MRYINIANVLLRASGVGWIIASSQSKDRVSGARNWKCLYGAQIMEESFSLSTKIHLGRLVAATLISLSLAAPSLATTITAEAWAQNGGLVRSDSQMSTSGAISAKAEVTPGVLTMSSASSDADGPLRVETMPWSWDIFSYGATASWSETFTNESARDTLYRFDFSGGGEGYITAPGDHFGEFQASVLGSVWVDDVLSWQDGLFIKGFYDDEAWEYLHESGSFTFGFPLYVQIAAGESVVFKYSLSASTTGCDHGSSRISGWMNGSLSPIPEPTSLMLLGTGLGLIGLVSWCRKQKITY